MNLLSAGQQPAPEQALRRNYVAPQLTVYGGLAELTASGSANESESASGMVAMCGAAFMFNSMGC
jgi:hypothetical protein